MEKQEKKGSFPQVVSDDVPGKNPWQQTKRKLAAIRDNVLTQACQHAISQPKIRRKRKYQNEKEKKTWHKPVTICQNEKKIKEYDLRSVTKSDHEIQK